MKQYVRLFKLDNVELIIDDGALKEIANESIKRHTGARGLRSILEDILQKVMFDIPSDSSVEKVRIPKEVVNKLEDPQIIKKSNSSILGKIHDKFSH